MTWPGEIYILRQMLPGAGTASLSSPVHHQSGRDPMNRTLAPADSVHYDPRLAKLSTLPASHACGSRPCTPTL